MRQDDRTATKNFFLTPQDLRDFAGHPDPRTTLTYIRSRDRLSKSPAYLLKY